MKKRLPSLALTLLLAAAAQPSFASSGDALAEAFRQPPDTARPLTMWQWMNGCVSKAGITADLEAFKRAGLGGVQQFLVGGSEAVLDDPSVRVLDPKWRELMAFAIEECARLGLSFGTHNCPGWSASGGPHVKVEQSMQKLVWSAAEFTGPGTFSGALARPEVDPRWDFYREVAVLAVPAGDVVARDAILDLGAAMRPDGQLVWQAPAGRWTLLRFGHTTTGHINGTAPVSGQGLECDKMSREALDAFWAGYPAEIINLAGPHAGRTLKRIEIDSYEAGPQDWTPAMRAEFQKRRGYDVLPWLATWAGRTVESPELTERFRRDWKQTVTELFTENYYGHMTELAHRTPGLELLVQPYATGGAPFDTYPIGQTGDVLMCEFWQKPAKWGWDSVKPVVAAARRSGKRIVAAEAFTGQPQYAWRQDPFALKSTGDRAFAAGVNQLFLHASAHNPWPDAPRPGMTMGWWGTQFGPGQTWWEHGGPEWLAYLTRCQYLLQQGDVVDGPDLRLAPDAPLLWIHRRLPDAEIYFVSNQADEPLTTTVGFRVSGRVPELWDASTGEIQPAPASSWSASGDHTDVRLSLDPAGSVFVVFRQPSNGAPTTLPAPPPDSAPATLVLDGAWELSFPPGLGAPESVTLERLISWPKHPTPGVKYFSGTATYAKEIDVPAELLAEGRKVSIDLGDVKNIASVRVNARAFPALWKPPFHRDITDALHAGKNRLEIRVTNLWPNRLIGDEQVPDDCDWGEPKTFGYVKPPLIIGRPLLRAPQWLVEGTPRPSSTRQTFATFKFFTHDSPLLPSGLLGPVTLKSTPFARP